MKKTYQRYLAALPLLALGLFLVDAANTQLYKSVSSPTIPYGMIIMKYGLIFAIGFCLRIFLNNQFQFVFSYSNLPVSVFAIILLSGNILTSIYFKELYLAFGATNNVLLTLVEPENKAIMCVIAGYLFGKGLVAPKA